jgi:hypothetical protein
MEMAKISCLCEFSNILTPQIGRGTSLMGHLFGGKVFIEMEILSENYNTVHIIELIVFICGRRLPKLWKNSDSYEMYNIVIHAKKILMYRYEHFVPRIGVL